MKSGALTFLFAALLSVAVTAALHAQAAFADKEKLKEDIGTVHGTPGPRALTGDKAVEHLKSIGQYDSLSAAITGARYGVKADPAREQTAAAANPAHGLLSTFTPDGVRLQIRTGGEADAPVHTVTWRLESLGYGAVQRPVLAGVLRTEGARVEITRTTPHLTEWFQNTRAGLEHGFTLPEPPATNPQSEPLRLVLAVTGDLAPEADATGRNLSLRDEAGRDVISYASLKVWDAAGKELSATMQTGAGCVILSVNEAAARYPLTIDPTFTQQAYLKASNTGTSDFFGYSVAVSGDTVVVGAGGEDSNATGVNGNQSNTNAVDSGAAYVFVRSGTDWSQQAYLKAFNTGRGDLFGFSVAVSGDTVVVGALDEDSNGTGVNGVGTDPSVNFDSGAAYVFIRSGTNWSQQVYLKASNTDLLDDFGFSVAVSGDTVVVGAPREASNATGVNGNQSDNNAGDSGAAYVFVRSGTIWSQQAYLKASNTGANDGFGSSVAVSGNTVVVGAPEEDSNATGVNGDGSNNSADGSGAAYVFVRNSFTGVWGQRSYLKASNTGADDGLGQSVAVAGGTVVVGAPFEDSNATGVNGDGGDNSEPDSGAAYVFVRGGTISIPTWSYRDYLKASNTEADDGFGFSVTVAGGTVVVGAPFEDGNATGVNGNQSDNNISNAGAAYVFEATVPEIAVEQPLNTNLPDGGSQDFVVIGGNNPSLTFTIKNTGNDPLTGLTITTDGTDAAMFTVTTEPVAPVAPGSNTTFTVRFAPTSPGAKTAALHLASNDLDENPFDIILQGFTLTFTQDTDGDGINDASEFQMGNFGFDWKVGQPALVANLLSNATGLGLFTASQLQALNVDAPLISRDPSTGLFKMTIGVQKSTDLIQFNPFPMTAPPTIINGQGKLEFQFSVPDNAAFFRLEAR